MEEHLPRKLAAILHADVVGYSRLAGADEDATHRSLKESLDLITRTVTSYHGRVINYSGDAVLAMFEAAVDALSCAVAIQRDITALNEAEPDERRIQFRIGVNSGDVIEDSGDIFGDGVNVAARLEGLADPGGICIAESVYTAVGSKLPLDYEEMGEQEVKNIDKPVRAYRVKLKAGAKLPMPSKGPKPLASSKARRWQSIAAALAVILIIAGGTAYWFKPWQSWLEPDSIEGMAFPLPDKPSIAVLAFDNLSGDPDREYLSDGITESIITRLARQPDMFVIARNSSFTYKDSPVKVQQVGRELGVQYVLEGSIQKAGERIRITAQLIDALSGAHLWADSYDRKLENLFDVQDEITQKVATELAVKLTVGEAARSDFQATANVEAYEYWLRGMEAYRQFKKETNSQAGELFEKAIELDPQYARAISILGWVRLNESRFWWGEDREKSFERAEELARQAINIDKNASVGHSLLGRIYTYKGQHEQAIAESKRSVAIEPSSAAGYASLAWTLVLAGMPEEGLEPIGKALRLSPYPPNWFLNVETNINYLTGRYEEAITSGRKHLDRTQEGFQALASWKKIIASYIELGRETEAQAEAEKYLAHDPDFSVNEEAGWRIELYKDSSWVDRFMETLRTAGLPE